MKIGSKKEISCSQCDLVPVASNKITFKESYSWKKKSY